MTISKAQVAALIAVLLPALLAIAELLGANVVP